MFYANPHETSTRPIGTLSGLKGLLHSLTAIERPATVVVNKAWILRRGDKEQRNGGQRQPGTNWHGE
ncbi:hypothetical protein C5167_038745 [Papaver somniferum]|uniref:Uncharacterized protein n=1 Tax=Papaver somniferum TaxID=3469 RepID=A0A4Y7IEF1_PAPSO|nr:hypothetical protein C5167_038745 [Papaver somniferum]